MITLQLLEDTDTILATDWCRPLLLITMSGGHSDFYSFECAWSGKPENNVKWVEASEILGKGWIGKTVREFNKAIEECGPAYEFVRGNIPVSHRYGKTRRQKREDYENYLKATISKFGKYKGKSWEQIKVSDSRYFEWACAEGLVKDSPRF